MAPSTFSQWSERRRKASDAGKGQQPVATRLSTVEQLTMRDEYHLARLGKRQALKRRFGLVSTLGLSTTLMLTWECLLLYLPYGLGNGGSAGLFTSFLLSWAGFMAIMVPLAELASMAPTCSGQYHWVFMLAPRRMRKSLSYITGWLSVGAWQAYVASGGITAARLIQSLLSLNYPDDYAQKGWHGTLMIWATVLLAFFVNSVLGRWLPCMEGFILYLHVLGLFAVIITLAHLSRRIDAEQVFTTWSNEGGWPSNGLAFFAGLITNVGPFLGGDSAIHMAEETQNAALVIPWNIVITIVFNGILGLGMLLTILFVNVDPAAVVDDRSLFNKAPFVQLFLSATSSTVGATGLATVVLVLWYASTFAQFASASRLLWAFARDRGPPFASWLVLISPKSLLPVNVLWTTCAISLLLGLINIGSEKALHSLLSFLVSSWEASCAIPLALLLYKRIRGQIRDRASLSPRSSSSHPSSPATVVRDHFTLIWGPWRVPEPLGTVINLFGLIWITIVFFFSFWPDNHVVAPRTMNWSSLITGSWVLFGVGYYLLVARKIYTGPIIETP